MNHTESYRQSIHSSISLCIFINKLNKLKHLFSPFALHNSNTTSILSIDLLLLVTKSTLIERTWIPFVLF